jgi:thioesterase superfamily protein 4
MLREVVFQAKVSATPEFPTAESRAHLINHISPDTILFFKSTTHNAPIMTTSKPHLLFEDEPNQQIKAEFLSTPWAIKLYEDPTLRPFLSRSRVRPQSSSSTRETFVSQTLFTSETISAWQSFFKPPTPSKPFEVICVLKLGSGLNGHHDLAHGGFLSVVLDDVIGAAAECDRPKGKSTMTAYLKVDYRKPVKTPGVLLARAWLEKTEGKKMWGRGTIEDGEGNVLADGEALFIVVASLRPKEKL